jgi:hypothetical protein
VNQRATYVLPGVKLVQSTVQTNVGPVLQIGNYLLLQQEHVTVATLSILCGSKVLDV